MKPWLLGLGFVGAAGLVGLSLPVINLLADRPAEMAPERLSGKVPSFAQAAPVFQNSCLPCHASQTVLPWYARMPVAQQIIEADMAEGRRWFNMEERLFRAGQAPDALALAKIEYALDSGEMPPLRYTGMHWRAWLTSDKIAAVKQWIADERRAQHPEPQAVPAAFLSEPLVPLPQTVLADVGKVALGRRLYHDVRLSGDLTISCASCHALDQGGTDRLKTSRGIHGQIGPINAPTVYNAVFATKQFWDGRAADLKAQALGPVTNPIEMGGRWDRILPRLAKDPVYAAGFQRLYGQPASAERVADAIATFESTLVTPHSPFDRYLRGEKTALTAQQQRGYQRFKSLNCQSCHVGPALGGQSFEKLGVKHDYLGDRGSLTDADLGRFAVTKAPHDKHRFKVPTLRNVAQTAPYFHDGAVATLPEAVEKMAYYQLGQRLSAQDTADIVAFLESLTGEFEGKPVR